MDLVIVYQAMLTVIIGVLVYAFGEIAVKFFVEPVNVLSQTIGEVLDTLIYYANIYTNPVREGESESKEMSELRKEAQKTLRQKGTLLISRANRVRWYTISSFFRILPKKDNIKEAHRELILLSNSCFTCDALKTYKSSERITELLA